MSTDPRTEEVSFDALASLLERVQAIARVRDEDLDSVLVDALRAYLDYAAASEEIRRRVAEQYYDDRIPLTQVEQLVGSVEAQRLQLLKDDLRDDPLEL